MYLSFEGLTALIGAILIGIGFPILLYGDHFDGASAPTRAGTFAKVITGIGMVLIVVPFILVASKMIWAGLLGLWQTPEGPSPR